MSDQQANAAFKQFNDDYRATSGAQSPGVALAGVLSGAGLKYESNPKHGSTAVGNVSTEPTNPQQVLENSVQIKNRPLPVWSGPFNR